MPSHITLGIMALYYGKKQLEERRYFRQLITRGEKMGMRVFVFTPEDVNDAKQMIYAHFYDAKKAKWSRQWTAFPSCIFDRCRYQPNKRFKQLRAFRAKYPQLTYLNRPLANKWKTHQVLYANPAIRAHLPASRMLSSSPSSSQAALTMLDSHRTIYLKPINGTGGRGIIRIHRNGSLYVIQGRDTRRRIIAAKTVNKATLRSKLNAWKKSNTLLMQQGIDIVLKNGKVHDYRMLLQKNGSGTWELTGCAGRVGAKRSITSNLHGGGQAVAMKDLMKQWFPNAKQAEAIQQNMISLSHKVVATIEQKLNKICELALDLAVDRSGHVWLFEINPKPSRDIFAKIGERDTYETALSRPLEYAQWLQRR